MDSLYTQLKKFGDVKTNVPLFKFTTFRIGGPAQFLAEVTETKKLAELLNFLSGEGIDYLILGGGSNILLPDEGIEGVVIKIKCQAIRVTGETIFAEAGAPLGAVVNEAAKSGLAGMEWAAGLPGTVGGAVRGNAGAMGGNIATVLKKAEVWHSGEVSAITAAECLFEYRDSIFKREPMVILGAHFKLAPGESKKSLAAMQEILKKRVGRYPPYPSAGSFFKNVKMENWKQDTDDLPQDFIENGRVSAGWLADKAGLKGFSVGGAMVSSEHGNFLINYQNATQADILSVVEEVKKRVYNMFGVELEEEVQIIH